MQLNSDFYSMPATEVARGLIGQYLVVNLNNDPKIVQITETEAYGGENDLASHARFGPTPRNSIMYGPPGRLYIYLIYGIHYLMNIITQPENSPSGVLIRGGIIINEDDATNFPHAVIQGATAEGREHGKISLRPETNINLQGPAKLTQTLGINKSHNNLDLTQSSDIFIAASGLHPKIQATPRIGIAFAPEPWRSIPWRFVQK